MPNLVSEPSSLDGFEMLALLIHPRFQMLANWRSTFSETNDAFWIKMDQRNAFPSPELVKLFTDNPNNCRIIMRIESIHIRLFLCLVILQQQHQAPDRLSLIVYPNVICLVKAFRVYPS
jgi:hypothetical protein